MGSKRNYKNGQTKYSSESVDLCCALVKQFGATQKQMARVLGCTHVTISNWKKAHPDFKAKLRTAWDFFNSEKTEKSLIRRANGYSWTQTRIQIVDGKRIVTTKNVHVPPDPACIKFYLTNRATDRWRNQIDVSHDHTHRGVIIVGAVPDTHRDWEAKFESATHPAMNQETIEEKKK